MEDVGMLKGIRLRQQEPAQRADGAMARVLAKAFNVRIGRVIRVRIAIDKGALTGGVEELRENDVALSVSGVEMGDGDAVGGVFDLRARTVKAGVIRILEPAPIEGRG